MAKKSWTVVTTARVTRLFFFLPTMRPLTEDESKLVFEKLANYIASIPP